MFVVKQVFLLKHVMVRLLTALNRHRQQAMLQEVSQENQQLLYLIACLEQLSVLDMLELLLVMSAIKYQCMIQTGLDITLLEITQKLWDRTDMR